MSVQNYQTTVTAPSLPTASVPSAPDVKQAAAILLAAGLHSASRGLLGTLRWLRDHIGTFGFAVLLLLVDAGQLPNPVTWIHWPPVPFPVPPGPRPPWPVPPSPGPVVTDKLRVLILYESSANMTAQQINTLNSTTIRGYLSTHCMTDSGRPAWRVWDADIDAAGASDGWKAALTATKADPAALPKVAIFADTKVLKIVPLPATEADTLTLLQSYGGH